MNLTDLHQPGSPDDSQSSLEVSGHTAGDHPGPVELAMIIFSKLSSLFSLLAGLREPHSRYIAVTILK